MLTKIDDEIAVDAREVFVVKADRTRKYVEVIFRSGQCVTLEPNEPMEDVADVVARVTRQINESGTDPYTQVVIAGPQMQEVAE